MTQGGGLLQLVAQGRQDVFLTGNPQVTWFKMVYRRYTNFSLESQFIPFDNQPDFGRKITCLLPRKGDLLGPLWLEIQLPALKDSVTGLPLSYTNSTAHALIQEVSLEIGDQEIDKQTGEWMEMYSNYTVTSDKKDAWGAMIGKTFEASRGNANSTVVNQFGPLSLFVPLRLWFNKNPGLYLPLLALQYHPIRLNITLRPLQQMFVIDNPVKACDTTAQQASITSMNLYGDYVHLDIDERRRFVANPHEYLIEQVQHTNSTAIDSTATNAKISMEFNHPIRELYWVVQTDAAVSGNQLFNYTNVSITRGNALSVKRDFKNMVSNCLVQLEGYDRFDTRVADYFRMVQPYQFHTVIPYMDYVYSYSFSFRPEDTQPSGSMNASRLDTMTLQLTMDMTVPRGSANCRVYALNHNVLRIVDGFGGLLFKL
jgi:hypothetical protein